MSKRMIRSSSLGLPATTAEAVDLTPIPRRFEKKRNPPPPPPPSSAGASRSDSKPPAKKPGLSIAEKLGGHRVVGLGGLSLSSPPREREDGENEWCRKNVDERYGKFLEACYHCKKKITGADQVYMYGYLRAFCSETCRNIQSCIDEKTRKPSPKSTQIHAENFIRRSFGLLPNDPRTKKAAAATK